MSNITINVSTEINAVKSDDLASHENGTAGQSFLGKLCQKVKKAGGNSCKQLKESAITSYPPTDEDFETAANLLGEEVRMLRMALTGGNLKMCRIQSTSVITVRDESSDHWICCPLNCDAGTTDPTLPPEGTVKWPLKPDISGDLAKEPSSAPVMPAGTSLGGGLIGQGKPHKVEPQHEECESPLCSKEPMPLEEEEPVLVPVTSATKALPSIPVKLAQASSGHGQEQEEGAGSYVAQNLYEDSNQPDPPEVLQTDQVEPKEEEQCPPEPDVPMGDSSVREQVDVRGSKEELPDMDQELSIPSEETPPPEVKVEQTPDPTLSSNSSPSSSPIKKLDEYRQEPGIEPQNEDGAGIDETADEDSFKLCWLPDQIARITMAIHKNVGAPIQFIALSLLGAFSMAVGKGIRIYNPVTGRKTWLNLQILMALPSGEGKSETGKLVFKPLNDLFREVVGQFETETIPTVKAKLARVKHAIGTIQKEGVNEHNQRQLAELFRQERELENALTPPKFMTKDATDAMVQQMLAENNGYISFEDFEARKALTNILGGTSGSRSQYSSEAIFLAGYSGDDLTSDRLSRQADIPEAVIATCFAAQPDKVESILNHPEMKDSGFIARQLPFFSRHRSRHIEGLPIPEEEIAAYRTLLQAVAQTYRIGNNFRTSDTPIDLELSSEQCQMLIQLHTEIREKICDGKITYHADAASRYAEQATKVVGCLHVMEHGSEAHSTPISDSCVRKAIAIVTSLFKAFQTITSGRVREYDQQKIKRIIELARSKDNNAVRPREVVGVHICSTVAEVKTLLDPCSQFEKVPGTRKDSVTYVLKD
jgi:hypothetical protein